MQFVWPSTVYHAIESVLYPSEKKLLHHAAQSCVDQITHAEHRYHIPKRLLLALALVESGQTRYNRVKMPWPWTIQTGGRSYFYKTKSQAVQAAQNFIKNGITNIDVGCLQINLKYHPHAFKSLDEAFEPHHNITYGAKFLKKLYIHSKEWMNSVSAYHSAHFHPGQSYCKQVLIEWKHKTNLLKPRYAPSFYRTPPQKIQERSDVHWTYLTVKRVRSSHIIEARPIPQIRVSTTYLSQIIPS